MIYFLDASALAKRYVSEPGSDDVRSLVRRGRALAASRLSSVEVPAAIWRRCRGGHLAPATAAQMAADVVAEMAEMRVVEIRSPVLDAARDLVARRPLRAYDAVQLASAIHLGREGGLAVTFVGADEALHAAAAAEGLRAMRVG